MGLCHFVDLSFNFLVWVQLVSFGLTDRFGLVSWVLVYRYLVDESLTNDFGFMVWVYVQLVHVGADLIGTDAISSTVIYI